MLSMVFSLCCLSKKNNINKKKNYYSNACQRLAHIRLVQKMPKISYGKFCTNLTTKKGLLEHGHMTFFLCYIRSDQNFQIHRFRAHRLF